MSKSRQRRNRKQRPGLPSGVGFSPSSSQPPAPQGFQKPVDEIPASESDRLLGQLRKKEGSWVDWGQSCLQLQQSGLTPVDIFEATGFEATHQNLVIVAAQVFQSLVRGGADDDIVAFFEGRGSDVLYELRILTESDRVAAATLAMQRGLDCDEAREVARALKEFRYLRDLPDGFEDDPGDAAAYQCWRLARQKSDLQERSRLIAQALRFVSSSTARRKIEALLTDFTVVRNQPAPRLPNFRLESAMEVPRILPVAGQLPMEASALTAVPFLDTEGEFDIVHFSGMGAWVALPNWQILMNSGDPVTVLCDSALLPNADENTPKEEVLVAIDREAQDWDRDSYFAVDDGGELRLAWFETPPELPILGKVILVLRPKRVFDEEVVKELWQVEE
ncbi:MAG: RuBisCO accumulation factor 1 [Cyanobacteria bacterium P01_C01_bin.89]